MSKKLIAYDVNLKRPACALLQAVMGGTDSVANNFDPDTWLVHPTPDMKVYAMTDDELKMLIKLTDKAKDENKAA